jgi:cyclopropane-fatty-acyl-phospholipid synthase
MTTASLDELSPRSIGRPPPTFRAVMAGLERSWRCGVLSVNAPGGYARTLPAKEPGPAAELEVLNWRLIRRVLTGGDVGFAEAYMAGDCDTPDLAAFLTAFSANFDHLARLLSGNPLPRLIGAVRHALHRNSKAGSRRNIAAHYDLGEDFYSLWLDPSMTYSSALFAEPGEDLQVAQRRKYAELARAMDLREGMSVLEVGCGWGGFAEFAGREIGAKVTAITVSRAQQAYAQARIQAAGLSERVEVKLIDYRDVQGRFDRVASIEMFEAVGEAFWPVYFDKLRTVLKPGGRAGLQIITIDENLFDGYRSRPDFIQSYIFPGGMLPSEPRLREETERAGLSWQDVRRFGQDYEWRRRFEAALEPIRALGFDARFERMWRYYLAYCEAGFRTGRTDVVHLTLGA